MNTQLPLKEHLLGQALAGATPLLAQLVLKKDKDFQESLTLTAKTIVALTEQTFNEYQASINNATSPDIETSDAPSSPEDSEAPIQVCPEHGTDGT